LGRKSKLARGLLWWAGKNKRGGEREGGPRGVKEDVGRVGLEETREEGFEVCFVFFLFFSNPF
jgi:hypothetical protein